MRYTGQLGETVQRTFRFLRRADDEIYWQPQPPFEGGGQPRLFPQTGRWRHFDVEIDVAAFGPVVDAGAEQGDVRPSPSIWREVSTISRRCSS